MIYLKQIFNGRTAPALAACLALLLVIMQVETTKITYKKSIQGKTNGIKEKYVKGKISGESKHTTTKSATVAPLAPPPPPTTPTSSKSTKEATATTNAATIIRDELNVAETTIAAKTELSTEEKPMEVIENEQQPKEPAVDANKQIPIATATPTVTNNSMEFQEVELLVENFEENLLEQQQPSNKSKNVPLDWVESQERAVIEEPLTSEENSTISVTAADSLETKMTATTIMTPSLSTVVTIASTLASTSTTDAPSTSSNRPVPCTCGVFMTSQIKRTSNPYEPPTGRPVIINELDRTFPCNSIGQKQCQTKCLETIVQHLPNSANILCASLDHDIRKERAYLFIKNCRSQWFNTNLAAGREYCCKNGQPYQCPLV